MSESNKVPMFCLIPKNLRQGLKILSANSGSGIGQHVSDAIERHLELFGVDASTMKGAYVPAKRGRKPALLNKASDLICQSLTTGSKRFPEIVAETTEHWTSGNIRILRKGLKQLISEGKVSLVDSEASVKDRMYRLIK